MPIHTTKSSVCVGLLVAVMALVSPVGARDEVPPGAVLLGPLAGQHALLYPHPEQREAGLVVVLHGQCDRPVDSCSFFAAGAARSGAHLLCPRANLSCDGGGFLWGGSPAAKEQAVVAARAAARERAPVRAGEGATLLGFSLGAHVAVELARRQPGQFTGLVLVSSSVPLEADSLRAAGIRRVWLAAGDFDQARPAMERHAAALARHGLEARFVSNGPVGHAYPPDMSARMAEALRWVRRPEGT